MFCIEFKKRNSIGKLYTPKGKENTIILNYQKLTRAVKYLMTRINGVPEEITVIKIYRVTKEDDTTIKKFVQFFPVSLVGLNYKNKDNG